MMVFSKRVAHSGFRS